MEKPHEKLAKHIKPETLDSRVTIDYRKRTVSMCYVFEHELKTIGSANLKTSLDIGFFGASVGALIAFAITLSTAELQSPYVYATYWALSVVASLSTLFFLFRCIISWREASQEVNRILEESKNRDRDVPE